MKLRKLIALLLLFMLLLPCVTAFAESAATLNDPTGRHYLNAVARALRLKENADPAFIHGELEALQKSAVSHKLKVSKAAKQALDEALRISGGFTESAIENEIFWGKELARFQKSYATYTLKDDDAGNTVTGDWGTVSGTENPGSVVVATVGDYTIYEGTVTPGYEGVIGAVTITKNPVAAFYDDMLRPVSKLQAAAIRASAGDGLLEGSTVASKDGPVTIIKRK
ncbi:MAG: hypothetical protein Q4E65_08630 [Clostridia bacterium]|nr:hypothetical protein [Clostridia bacterium]